MRTSRSSTSTRRARPTPFPRCCWNPLGPTATKGGAVEPLPDLGTLSDVELKTLIDELQQEERDVSYRRRLLHGKIDILRAELVSRLRESGGRSVLDEVDVERL